MQRQEDCGDYVWGIFPHQLPLWGPNWAFSTIVSIARSSGILSRFLMFFMSSANPWWRLETCLHTWSSSWSASTSELLVRYDIAVAMASAPAMLFLSLWVMMLAV